VKVALLSDKRGAALYTAAALRVAMKDAGVIETDIGQADAVWFSMCDVTEHKALIRARKQAGQRPLIMGGFEAWMPTPWLAWADAVVVGEGWEFIEAWGRSADEAMGLPCVATRNQDAAPIPSTAIRWDLCPLVCVPGHRKYLYLASRGCHRRCPFCLTGSCQPYQVNDTARLVEVARAVKARKARLTWVTNDSKGLPPAPVVVHSITATDYLDNPLRHQCGLVRIGLEGWTAECRTMLGKPLSNRGLRTLVDTLEVNRQPAQFFFMADYPGWHAGMEKELQDAIGPDKGSIPPIFIKVTYFDPMPGTELGGAKVSGQWCDTVAMFHRLGSYNHRIRIWGTRSRARSAWRTMMHRCTTEQARIAPSEPKGANAANSFDEWRGSLPRDLRALLAARDEYKS